MADTTRQFVHIAFPSSFVHPYSAQDKTGKQWDKAIITIPRNTYLDAHDIAYYNLDVFMNQRMSEQKRQGKNVVVSIRSDTPCELFKGRGDKRETILIDNPWQLASAVKKSRETYNNVQGSDDTNESILVSLTCTTLPVYSEPIRLPINQADWELGLLDDVINDLQFRYPAENNPLILTASMSFKGKSYEEKLFLGEGYRSITDLIRDSNTDMMNGTVQELLTRLREDSTLPLEPSQWAESQQRVKNICDSLSHSYQEDAQNSNDEEYLAETVARNSLDTQAITEVNNIPDELIAPYVTKLTARESRLMDAYGGAQEAADSILATHPGMAQNALENSITRKIYMSRLATHLARRIYEGIDPELRVKQHPSMRKNSGQARKR